MDQLSPFSHTKFLINSALATELFINDSHTALIEKRSFQALFRFSEWLFLGIHMKADQPPQKSPQFKIVLNLFLES